MREDENGRGFDPGQRQKTPQQHHVFINEGRENSWIFQLKSVYVSCMLGRHIVKRFTCVASKKELASRASAQ